MPLTNLMSCGVASKELSRDFIGIELDDKYFEIAKNRIEEEEFKKNFKKLLKRKEDGN